MAGDIRGSKFYEETTEVRTVYSTNGMTMPRLHDAIVLPVAYAAGIHSDLSYCQGLRMTKANVTHPELQATFQLEILGRNLPYVYS